MTKPVKVSLLCLLLCAPVFAQGRRDAPGLLPSDPGVSEVRELLRSEAPRDVALGAAIVRRDRTLALSPELTSALERHPPGEKLSDEGKLAVLGLLDTIVTLDARVPTAAVLPWARVEGHHLGAVVAIAKNGRDADLLLELFDRAGGRPSRGGSWWMSAEVWLAAGNALSEGEVRELVPRLMARYRAELTIVVREDPAPSDEPPPVVGEYESRDRLAVPEGFPPLAVHILEPDAQGRGIRIERRELLPGPNTWERRSGWLDWEGLRWRWISKCLGGDFGLRPRTRVTLGWESEERFLVEAEAVRDAAIAQYWKSVKRLLEKGLLTVEEARTLGPAIAVHVEDERGKPRESWLPDLREPVLRCPFPLGEGPPPGTPPDVVRRSLAAPAEVRVNQFPRREKRVEDPGWIARFRTVLGELGPDRYAPALTSWSPEYGVEFRMPGGGHPVEVRLDLENEYVRILVAGDPLDGYWSIRGRRVALLKLMTEQYPPEKGGRSRFASVRDELWHIVHESPEVRVYAFRAQESRAVDAGWAERFRKLVGRPDPDRYYLSLPAGLHEPEYEVIFSPPEDAYRQEDVAFRISFRSGYFSMRRSDMGLVGFWSFGDVLPEVLELVKQAFPEERRSK